MFFFAFKKYLVIKSNLRGFGVFSEIKFDNFSETSNTIKMHNIKEIEKKNVPINRLSIYLSSILSIIKLPLTRLWLTN